MDETDTFDVLSGMPSSPLPPLAGAPDDSPVVAPGTPTPGTYLAGCGPPSPGCPAFQSAGESAIPVLFDADTDLFGLEVLTDGGFGSSLGVPFFSRTGALLDAFTLTGVSGLQFFGFKVVGGDWIGGVSLTNTDPFGVGYGSMTFSAVPEPSTASLLLLGLAGLGLAARPLRAGRA